jgi:hypothetical protein
MKQTIHTRTLIKRHMALGITALALGVTAAAVSVIPSNAAAKLSLAKATVCLKDETCKAVKQKITLKGTNKTYTVKVANSKIASVKKSGKTITITGKKTGSTVLSVKVKNGKTLKCKIAVKNHSYNEAVMNDSNGKEYTLYTCKYCGSSYEERITEIEEGYSMNLADYASQWKYIAEYDCYGDNNASEHEHLRSGSLYECRWYDQGRRYGQRIYGADSTDHLQERHCRIYGSSSKRDRGKR